MLDGQGEPPPNRNPSCVAAEESGRRLARAVLESMDAIKLDAVVYPLEQPAALIGALNLPHDKSADKRQSLETKPISRGTESSNPPPSSEESSANSVRDSAEYRGRHRPQAGLSGVRYELMQV